MNSEADLEEIRSVCKTAIKEISRVMKLAENLDDKQVLQRLMSAQSKLLFTKFRVHYLLYEQGVEIVYEPDEICSDQSVCPDCPC
jgi:hypothetical protein